MNSSKFVHSRLFFVSRWKPMLLDTLYDVFLLLTLIVQKLLSAVKAANVVAADAENVLRHDEG